MFNELMYHVTKQQQQTYSQTSSGSLVTMADPCIDCKPDDQAKPLEDILNPDTFVVPKLQTPRVVIEFCDRVCLSKSQERLTKISTL